MRFADMEGWEVLAFGVAGLLSAILCGACRFVAPRVGFVDKPRADRHSERVTALGGGVGWFSALVLLLAAGSWAASHSFLPSALSRHIPGIVSKLPALLWIMSGGAMLMLAGLIDDCRPIGPTVKLCVQFIVAAILVNRVPEVRMSLFVEGDVSSAFVTMIWIVAWSNAFNLLDHADGVSSGTGVAVFMGLAVLSAYTGQLFIGVFSLLVAGALVGFLVHNLPPARLFMGDAGSLPLGYLVAVMTAIFTFYLDHDPRTVVFTPLCLLAVPFYDTVSVLLIRRREKRPLFQGDKCHFVHRLLALGYTPNQALAVIFGFTFLGGVMAYLTLWLHESLRWLPPLFMLVVLLVLARTEKVRL